MKSQFGWGAYAMCECRAEERLGWYEGEEVTVDEWEGLGKREGREHTVRVSWAGNGRTPCINGIDGVAGMQYSPVSKRWSLSVAASQPHFGA